MPATDLVPQSIGDFLRRHPDGMWAFRDTDGLDKAISSAEILRNPWKVPLLRLDLSCREDGSDLYVYRFGREVHLFTKLQRIGAPVRVQ